MGLRIRTNVSSLSAQRFSENNKNQMDKSLERLSSGYRINRSADDAAGLAVSENMRAEVRGLNQAKRNASDAVSMVQVAEGSLNEMTNILVRMRELTIQASSDTIGDTERGYLNREYTQLVDEIDRIGNTTEFNSYKFFESGGRNDDLVIQVGVNESAPRDNADTLSINLKGLQELNSKGFRFGNRNEIGPSNPNGRDAVSRQNITKNLTNIDNALNKVSGERATLGSFQSRLTSAVNTLSIQTEGISAARSRIQDVDFADEASQLAQSRVLQSSSLSVLTQANATPEMALQLLR